MALSVGLLVKWVAFLGTLHWSVGGLDLGVGGVSHVEILILYELWAGERLDFEKALPRYRRAGRPISVSAVPFGPGVPAGHWSSFLSAWCFAWWFGYVSAVLYRRTSLQASTHWVGEVWTRSHFQAERVCLGGFLE